MNNKLFYFIVIILNILTGFDVSMNIMLFFVNQELPPLPLYVMIYLYTRRKSKKKHVSVSDYNTDAITTGLRPILARDHFSPVDCDIILQT